MTTAEMLVIAVPSGAVTGGVARLRVLFVPRLQADGPATLADFGLEDWPALLANATFSAETASDPATARPLTLNAPAARGDSAVWRGFFAPTMPVDPWQAQSYPTPHVDPTADKATRVTASYAESAQAYVDPGADAATVVRAQYAGWTDDDPDGPDSGIAPDGWQAPDFHRSVSMLREHSAVLLQLGLIVEVTIDVAALPRSPVNGAPLLVRIRCALGAGAPPVTLTPMWTQYAFDGARFLPFAPGDSDVAQGMLDLAGAQMAGAAGAPAGGKWLIATFDVDGAVGRLRDGAKSGGASADLAEGVSLPVLHSVGPTLIRAGRAEHLERRAARGRGNMRVDAAELQLSADDLILGYRVDIRPQSGGAWTSLCQRTATYRIDGQPIGTAGAVEDSHIKANAAALGRNQVLQTNEIVARWSGWSLARPRPILDQNGPVPSATTQPPLPFAFDWSFDAAAPLPQLRFGAAYRMRLRVADMAGGGLTAGDIPGNQFASGTILYRRHEPIAPPEMAPPPDLAPPDPPSGAPPVNGFGVGGSLDCLVLRSDPGAGSDIAAFATAHPGYPQNDRRWLLPPAASFTLAEQHGKLDGADEATWLLAQRAMAAPQAATDGAYNWLPDPAALGVMAFVRPNPEGNGSGATADTGWGAWPDIAGKRLAFGPPVAGRPLIEWTIDADGALLTVRLPPAADIEVELSSFPDATQVDQFEIKSWLAGAPDTAVVDGRHPMVTPPRVVRFVHAVRKPLTAPAGAFAVTRGAGQTVAALNTVAANPRLGVDFASTGQVDVVARWNDMVDYPAYVLDGLAPDAPVPEPAVRTDTLASVRIDRDMAALPEIRHELGETAHRTISYTATAISRFGQYFDDGPGDAFTQTSDPIVAQIPSAARPLPPVILAAAPAYRWESVDAAGLPAGAIRRRRLGGRLRIELARPWHKSGEGERLAVILATGDAAQDEQASRIFRDPIWQTGLPAAALDAGMFADPASAAPVTLADGSRAVAVPFVAAYDRGSGRWHADIAMPGAIVASYAPFVRLRLARYQTNCLAGLEISPTVLTDFLPLAPDRTLTVAPSGDGYDVTLEGLAPAGPRANQLIVAAEEADAGAGDGDLTSLQPGGRLWTRLPGAAATGAVGQPLHLPLAAAGAGKRRRLVVREVEAIDLPFDHPIDDHFLSELHQRTVFLDIVAI